MKLSESSSSKTKKFSLFSPLNAVIVDDVIFFNLYAKGVFFLLLFLLILFFFPSFLMYFVFFDSLCSVIVFVKDSILSN